MKKLTIIVFGYSAQSISEWISKHRPLLSDTSMDFHFAYFDGALSFNHMPENICASKGAENWFERVRSVLVRVSSEFTLLAAADDQILQLPVIDTQIQGDMIVGSNYFLGSAGKHLEPSDTNPFAGSDIPQVNLQQYWKSPYPGDNSIFYSIVRTSILKEVYAMFPAGLLFHAQDWAFVHFILARAKVIKNHEFVQVRQRTPSEKYTANIVVKYPQFDLTTPENLILQNPLGYALKYIYEHDLRHGFGLDSNTSQGMLYWLCIKLYELANQGVAVNQQVCTKLSAQYLTALLEKSSLSDFHQYEA